jgi:3-oxoacyl-[acyl-carrier-protein] synthase-3
LTIGNDELAEVLGVTPAWIHARCGFERRPVARDETTRTLAVNAARTAIARPGTPRPDCFICATFTPDYQLCPIAPTVAYDLGFSEVPAFDLNAACSGGLMAFLLGVDLLTAGSATCVMVIASDTTSKYVRPDDTSCRILFGDGAAALVIGPGDSSSPRILSRVVGSDGSGSELFRAGPAHSVARADPPYVQMQGPALFRFAVGAASRVIAELCRRAGVDDSEIGTVIVHQANHRIIEAAAARSKIPSDRWVINSTEVGNLGAASVLFAWADHLARRAVKRGDKTILAAFGAGLTWAGILVEW